ncbi:Pycsar system effector family protein [Streptomyces sp. NPDC017941]|uniref:Pycsar system effector family protein n=1 Tax=Streptomyces sp. NPDC017941 TaxID=3365018 RepID=UPI0037909E47
MPADEIAPDRVRAAGLARTLLTEAREELLKADSKAGVLLAFLGAALTALLGAMCGGAVQLHRFGVISQVLLWVGCVTCVTSLVLLGMAITPRVGIPCGSRVHYFGDASVMASMSHLDRAVRLTDPVVRDVSQLAIVSRTVWIKYRCIQHAMICGAAFVALTSMGIVTGVSI